MTTFLPVGRGLAAGRQTDTPPVAFETTFGGDGHELGYSLTVTSDGGYAVCGATNTGSDDYDALLVKTDADGDVQWRRRYGGKGTERALSVVRTDDGGFLMAGVSDTGRSRLDGWLVRTDADGDELWDKQYTRGFNGYLNSVVRTSDGGFLAAGSTNNRGGDDAWLLKTDAEGGEEWSRTYADEKRAFQWARSVVTTPDGGYAFAGKTVGDVASVLLVKTDAAGNEKWRHRYGASGHESAYDLVRTGDGGFALAGLGADFSDPVARLIKTDAVGNEEWSMTFEDGERTFTSLVEAPDGSLLASGHAIPPGAGSRDAWFVKVDAAGEQSWSKLVGSDDYDLVTSTVTAPDGGYAFCGLTRSGGAGFDAWLGKLDAPNETPVAAFKYSPFPSVVGEPTTFDASASNDPDGSVAAYEWDFEDDGRTDERGRRVERVFDNAGRRTVTLTVRDDDGATDTVRKSVTVYVRVDVDVKPGSDVNPVNPASNGTVDVAILRTDGVDPRADVDVASLRFGHAETVESGGGVTPERTAVRDVDGDGRDDLVVTFPVDGTGFGDETRGRPFPGAGVTDATETAKLAGETTDADPLFGYGTVRVAGNGGGPRGSNGRS